MSNVFKPGLYSGKTALITGGGSGIGFAIAQTLGRLGCRVVIAARDTERLAQASSCLMEEGIDVICHEVNIRDPQSIDDLYSSLQNRDIQLDILVNNAGGQFAAPALDISPNGFKAVVELNLNGTFLMSQRFTGHCIERKIPGAIINIVLCQENGLPGMAHAAAARSGVVNLTKTLAWEWAPHHIRVNAIAPGTIRTSGLENYDQANLQAGIDKILIKRMGEPEEIAQTVAFLASPAAAFITGTCIAQDGGEHLTGASVQC
ncbi:SDR family oxidoreductase [Parasalinivibrio latis]|uniref:SDR family oxidoreductase n=1 Tax=Parasalinivibrio latis TaxID=2952610 RepID=UPI0030E10476